MRYIEYAGMSYEQASREAARLIKQKGWFQSFDRLRELYNIMLKEESYGPHTNHNQKKSAAT